MDSHVWVGLSIYQVNSPQSTTTALSLSSHYNPSLPYPLSEVPQLHKDFLIS